MNMFVDAAMNNRETYTYTENGALTLSTSSNDCVDFFFNIGAMRGQQTYRLHDMFTAAYNENPDLAVRILLWGRDVRGGAGERQVFRNICILMERAYPDALEAIIHHIPFYGRWDDLLIFKTEKFKNMAFTLIAKALSEENKLCAKWMPRETRNKDLARELRDFLGLNWKDYRKLLSQNTEVVESLMCSKRWGEIEFEKVPSLAIARYQNAFKKNDGERFREFAERAKNGEANVNTGAVYPYDVLKTAMGELNNFRYLSTNYDRDFVIAQWDQLPNFMGDNSIVPMVDVSSSMEQQIPNSNLTALDVAVSLGLYVADKQEGAYHGLMLNFSTHPKFMKLSGNIVEKIRAIDTRDWGFSTNVNAAFDKILEVAVKEKVPADQMPKYVIIFSDMEFDECGKDLTNYEKAKSQFALEGYDLPNVIFWNLCSRNGNSPVRFDKEGTALVSGFSPSIMKSILAGENMNPENIMLEAVMIDRYDVITK